MGVAWRAVARGNGQPIARSGPVRMCRGAVDDRAWEESRVRQAVGPKEVILTSACSSLAFRHDQNMTGTRIGVHQTPTQEQNTGAAVLDNVNFHSRPRYRAWAEYTVLVLALVTAMALLAGARMPMVG